MWVCNFQEAMTAVFGITFFNTQKSLINSCRACRYPCATVDAAGTEVDCAVIYRYFTDGQGASERCISFYYHFIFGKILLHLSFLCIIWISHQDYSSVFLAVPVFGQVVGPVIRTFHWHAFTNFGQLVQWALDHISDFWCTDCRTKKGNKWHQE